MEPERSEATARDSIRDRITPVDNLPLLGVDKQEELQAALRKAFSDIAMVAGIFMPIDESTKQLKGYTFVEVVSHQKVDHAVKKMHRHKLKAPGLVEDIPNLRDGNVPRGVVQITRYANILKADSKDARVTEFLRAKLVKGQALTPECQAALTEIFNSFGGERDGALVAHSLNELQVASNGKPLSIEQIEFALKTYKSKPVGETRELGLVLEGFLDLYLRQCMEAPLDTWEELAKLGYDLNLNHNRFMKLEAALASQADWTPEADSQLVEYGEILYADCEVSSPIHMCLDHIKPFNGQSAAFPFLAKRSLPAIRLRFEILKQFNSDLFAVLPLVNFDRKHEGSLTHLLSQCRTLMFHTCKMDFIYEVLDKTSVQAPQPTVTIDRLKLAAKKEREDSETPINRTMFGIAFQQLRTTNPAAYRQKKPGGAEPHFSIKIVFKGENVQGEGGPYRQFFTDVSKELQGILPLLIPCPNAQQGLGENRDKWVICPSSDSAAHIAMFEFLGRLMGCSIRTGVLLILDLPSFFWKPLVGVPPKPSDLMLIDESLGGTLKYLAECTKEDLERDIDETFTTFLSDKTKVPLKEGGENIKVTIENRDEYIRLVEKVRLSESNRQLAALRRGLGEVIPLHLLDLCTAQDLEWKVCGKPIIDVNLLRRHTMCSGVSGDAQHISFFWNTLFEFNQQDRRGFLRFAWAQERLPVNDEEFERTKTRMMIKPFPGLQDPNAAFPKADTCFFNIMLPEYTSQRVLRERLLYAIYTDSHSMNADEPQEDELQTVEGRRRGQAQNSVFDYSSESDSE